MSCTHSAPIVLDFHGCEHQPRQSLVGTLTHLPNRPSISLPSLAFGPGHAPPPPWRHEDIISPPVLILFLNCVLLQDLRSRPRWSRSQNRRLLSSGAVLVKLCIPLGSILGTDLDFVHPNHALVGPIVAWFSASNKFSLTVGGAPTPAMIFPLLGKIMLINHVSLGFLPRIQICEPCVSRVTLTIQEVSSLHPGQLFRQVKSRSCPRAQSTLRRVKSGSPLANQRYRALHHSHSPRAKSGHPSQSRRYRALHPGQLSARSSRGLVLAPINSLSGQVGVTPHKIRRYRALHHINSLLCQVGGHLAIQEVSALTWSTLCQVKSGPHPRTDQHSVRLSEGSILGLVSCSGLCFF